MDPPVLLHWRHGLWSLPGSGCLIESAAHRSHDVMPRCFSFAPCDAEWDPISAGRRRSVSMLARRIADSARFQTLILGVILFNGVLIGLETSETIHRWYGEVLTGIDLTIQAIFVLEISIRLAAYWPRPWRFFANGWNVFDFIIVAGSLLPQAGTYATIARLARLLRVTRVVSVFPELRLIVNTMLRSIPSMGHVLMMLSLLLYVYAVLGVYMFRDADAEHWGSLGAALWTLFQMLTLEGWVDVQGVVQEHAPWSWLYFASFVFIGVFVVVNLFIAVVINNLESVKVEHQEEADRASRFRRLLGTIEDLKARLDELERVLRREESAVEANRLDLA
jgi:voltage-gated sodium channel